jgi:uncharacterized membrane protein YgaE (UPF0421/DUF939 family)
MTRDQQTILKIIVAFTLAIAIAWLFQLPGTITTGILAIISIQPTKTDTLSIIWKVALTNSTLVVLRAASAALSS